MDTWMPAFLLKTPSIRIPDQTSMAIQPRPLFIAPGFSGSMGGVAFRRIVMKKKLGAVNALYPMPTVLVGANVAGKPNYVTIAHVGIVTLDCIAISFHKTHYTNTGIKENSTFSVNIPSEDMVKEADYCGTVTGRKVDKSQLFENFYGTLRTAPMIARCPLNMACQLIDTVNVGAYDFFIGPGYRDVVRRILPDGRKGGR